MAEKMWFGTRYFPMWIPMIAAEADTSKENWNTKSKYLNGGGRVRRSKAAQRTFTMTWNFKSRDEVRPITDFADGVYDTEDGANPIYFIHPVAALRNVAPQNWGFPGQAKDDAMPLFEGIRPSLIVTPSNTLYPPYPARSARYVLTGTEVPQVLYVPIPPGKVAWVGAHGSATGATGVQVTPFNGSVSSAPTTLTMLGANTTTRVSSSFSSSLFTGIEIQPIAGAGTLDLYGVIIQILDPTDTPVLGGYLSGQGHSGCEFDGGISEMAHQITPQQESITITAKMIETGAWV